MTRPLWFVVLIHAMASLAWSTSPSFQTQFRSDDAAAGDDFGRSVAIDGKLGIVGAPLRDEAELDSGAAFIFDLSTGLFIPYTIATACVVIAAASQFHGEPYPGLLTATDAEGQEVARGKMPFG